MKATTQRKFFRWVHIILSIPILGYIYGPVAAIPEAAIATRFVFVPMVILSGLYMWKGHILRKALNSKNYQL